MQVLQVCEDKMIKKNLHLILILTLFSLLCLNTTEAKIFEEDGKYYVEQELETEWNLVAGISFSNFHEDTKLNSDHFLSSYYFNAQTQENIEIRPVYSVVEIDSLTLYKNAFWVYSISSGTIIYQVSTSFISKDNIAGGYQFYSGKNLIAINNEMYGKTLTEIKGNCNIVNASIWNPKTQLPETININEKLDFESQDNLTGKGINIEVIDDCRFIDGSRGNTGGGNTGGNSGSSSSSSTPLSTPTINNSTPLENSSTTSPNTKEPSTLSELREKKPLIYFFIVITIIIVLILISILIYIKIVNKEREEKDLNNLTPNQEFSKSQTTTI